MPLSVLVIDDQPLEGEMSSYILHRDRPEVTYAGQALNAADGIRMAGESKPDLIFLDIKMPGMDGLTATREIRTLPRKDAGTIPIFAMTANAFADDIRQSKEINFFYDMDRRRILRG